MEIEREVRIAAPIGQEVALGRRSRERGRELDPRLGGSHPDGGDRPHDSVIVVLDVVPDSQGGVYVGVDQGVLDLKRRGGLRDSFNLVPIHRRLNLLAP